jgi:hypothetical protein
MVEGKDGLDSKCLGNTNSKLEQIGFSYHGSLEGDDNIEAFMDEAIDIPLGSSTNEVDKRPIPKGTPSPSEKVNTLLHDLSRIMLLPLGF